MSIFRTDREQDVHDIKGAINTMRIHIDDEHPYMTRRVLNDAQRIVSGLTQAIDDIERTGEVVVRTFA